MLSAKIAPLNVIFALELALADVSILERVCGTPWPGSPI